MHVAAREGVGSRVIGQFRATRCPVCGSDDIGRWTCALCTALVDAHRELLRNLQQWQVLYEVGEVPDVLMSGLRSFSLWDGLAFYDARNVLPERQQQSLQFCLYENMKERDAAVRMGIGPTNPVSIYATIGLTSLITLASQGEILGYRIELLEDPRVVV